MKILHVIPTFYPATYWGGPIYSTKIICDELSKIPENQVRVLTSDSAGPRLSQRTDTKNVHFPYVVKFCRRILGNNIAPSLLWRLIYEILIADVVHLTSVYSFPTLPTLLICKIFNKPIIWSPRGEILATETWADVPKRRLKIIYEYLANYISPKSCIIHATSSDEVRAIMVRFGRTKTVIIPNAVEIPTTPQPTREQIENRRIMFLSRLHQKKGIERLLNAMAELPDCYYLDIYGEGEEGYETQLRDIAQKFGQRVTFHGFVDGEEKAAAFYRGGVFVLPSFTENFGNAVAEALAHGMPVITTTSTPWEGLEKNGCGRCIDLEKTSLSKTIYEVLNSDLYKMGAHGRSWIEREFSSKSIVKELLHLYQSSKL